VLNKLSEMPPDKVLKILGDYGTLCHQCDVIQKKLPEPDLKTLHAEM
jgi:hypothetical protein